MNLPKRFLLIQFLLLSLLLSCSGNTTTGVTNSDEKSEVKITILYTNDEHGWMEGRENYGGAAEMLAAWKSEGLGTNENVLALSGGDMWTGPAICNLFEGESMQEVMNQMGYTSVAIGNHEFDNKVEALNERLAESNFPYLSANIRLKTDNTIPSFATPYIIKEIDGVKLGIIGLTTTSTPSSAFPIYVQDFNFINYTTALEEYIPQMKEEGAELIILTGHIPVSAMQSLVNTAKSLDIAVMFGGHDHRISTEIINGVGVLESGSNLRSYIKLEIVFNDQTDEVISLSPELIENKGSAKDQAVAEIIDKWADIVKDSLSGIIGYASNTIDQSSAEMKNMILDSWLYEYSDADVALTNSGGIRQDIPAGDISLETIYGLLPFENQILKVELTGAQLKTTISYFELGGISIIGGIKFLDGTPVHDDSLYTVLTIDYLYYQNDSDFQLYDSTPEYTSDHYRDPLIKWIRSKNTSISNPLNQYLDNNPRR